MSITKSTRYHQSTTVARSNKQKTTKETKKEDHKGGTGMNVSSCGGVGFEAFFPSRWRV